MHPTLATNSNVDNIKIKSSHQNIIDKEVNDLSISDCESNIQKSKKKHKKKDKKRDRKKNKKRKSSDVEIITIEDSDCDVKSYKDNLRAKKIQNKNNSKYLNVQSQRSESSKFSYSYKKKQYSNHHHTRSPEVSSSSSDNKNRSRSGSRRKYIKSRHSYHNDRHSHNKIDKRDGDRKSERYQTEARSKVQPISFCDQIREIKKQVEHSKLEKNIQSLVESEKIKVKIEKAFEHVEINSDISKLKPNDNQSTIETSKNTEPIMDIIEKVSNYIDKERLSPEETTLEKLLRENKEKNFRTRDKQVITKMAISETTISETSHTTTKSDRHRVRSRERRPSIDRYASRRSRSRESRRRHHHNRHRSRSREYHRRSRSSDKSRNHYSDNRHNSPDKSRKEEDRSNDLGIDKAKLRKIAISRTLQKLENGQMDGNLENIANLRSGGTTVDELTSFCKRMQDPDDDSSDHEGHSFTSGENVKRMEPTFETAFKNRELPASAPIVMNITNSKNIAILTSAEKLLKSSILRKQFPVSTGGNHIRQLDEWVEVKNKPEEPIRKEDIKYGKLMNNANSSNKKKEDDKVSDVITKRLQAMKNLETNPTDSESLRTMQNAQNEKVIIVNNNNENFVNAMSEIAKRRDESKTRRQLKSRQNVPDYSSKVKPPRPTACYPSMEMVAIAAGILPSNNCTVNEKRYTFSLNKKPPIIVTQSATNGKTCGLQNWASTQKNKSEHDNFGRFTGTSTRQPSMSMNKYGGPQAWIHKDLFAKAAPVKSDIGMNLMSKMGWKSGEGLGKNNDGELNPLSLDFKINRRGLTSSLEAPPAPTIKSKGNQSGLQHPVAMLNEFCSKRGFRQPIYTIVSESGPPHMKCFLFKVIVNGISYQPASGSTTKKLAKADSATTFLQNN